MATGTAKRQAYRWRHRTHLFLHTPQPAWVRGLRRAWLKNPRTLDMLGLEPVSGRHLKGERGGKGAIVVDATTGQIVAYREKATGRLIAPEDAGPKALPVLITTPLKVTREYGKEILAAFPCAEVVPIESHRDIPRWLERCVTSDRPVVFGIFSHSTTRAFGREWREVVREKQRTIREPILNPPAALRDQLEPVYEEGGRKQRLVGYRFIENGKLLTKDKEISYFYCPDCGGRIDAVPGRLSQPDEKEEDKKKQGKQAGARSADDAEEEATSSDKVWPVTSRTWFTSKQRWCRCASTRRNQERRERGVAALRSPLWSDDRTKATNRKFPQASFHTWSAAVSTLEHEAEQALAHVSNRELAERVRRDDALVHRLVECVLADPWALASVVTLVERVDGQIVPFLQSVATDRSALARLILPVAQRDPAFLAPLLAGARDDELLCQRLVEAVLAAEPEEIMPLEQEPSDPILALVLEVALRVEAVAQALLQTFLPQDQLASLLVDLATRDLVSFKNLIPRVVSVEAEVLRLVGLIRDAEAELAERLVQAVRRDGSSLLLLRLVEVTRPHMDWQPLFFRSAVERVQTSLSSKQARKSGGNLGGSLAQGNRQPGRGVRLTVTEGGPLIVEEPDLAAAEGYTEVSEHGSLVAYEMGHQGRRLYPLYGRWSRRIVGYVDAGTGQLVTTQTSFSFGMPPADSFSPYEYLDAFFPGCVALAVVDESHNGRGRSTDIAHSHHCAMLAAQTRELTSGTHYGGDILGFYHYWFRFTPQFWLSRGYGWNDAEKALADYGVIQEWTKEYESDARKGSGQTDVYVSTVPAPGLSANLIPGLLEDLTYLTVLDVGAHMPPKEEIPRGIPMKDPHLEAATREADQAVSAARQAVKEIQAERTAILQTPDSRARQTCLADIDARLVEAQARLKEAQSRLVDVRLWVSRRDLAAAYTSIADNLAELASERNAAARLAQGTIPRWFAALPCESPFQLYQAKRGDWGDKEEPELVIETPVLSWDYLYPMERWFVEVARAELAEGRRVMFYFEQNAVRSMAKRLAWVLKEFNPWTLPNGVEAEERQQAIIEAVEAGHGVVIVPYRRVNEGLNLQKVIDTIVWAELAQNLFFYTQASQRAWRLGKENLVKIYIPYYIGSAAHKQVRRLGERDGAAAAFAGEPAKGGLVHHVGADQTTLARLSAQIEEGERAWWEAEAGDDSAVIEANFARRNAELAAALRQGREWFGLVDTLAERLSAILAGEQPDVWASMPPLICLPEVSLEVVIPPDVEHAPAEQQEPVETPTKPASGGLSPATVSTESGDRPEPPTVLHPAVSASSVQPPRVAILFGNEADIQRVRLPRKGRSRRTLPKLKHPVIVKDIPAVVESNTAPAPVQDDLLLLSLWDTAGMPEDPATPAGPPSRPAGSSLPAGSLWDLADAS